MDSRDIQDSSAPPREQHQDQDAGRVPLDRDPDEPVENSLRESAPPTRTASAPLPTDCCAATSRPAAGATSSPSPTRPELTAQPSTATVPTRTCAKSSSDGSAYSARQASSPTLVTLRSPGSRRGHPVEGTPRPVSLHDQRGHRRPDPDPGPAGRPEDEITRLRTTLDTTAGPGPADRTTAARAPS